MGEISKLPVKMPESNNTYVRLNASGLLEIISEETGEVIAVQKSKEDLMLNKNERLVELKLDDGRTLLYEKGINLDLAVHRGYKIDSVIAGVICQRIAEGAKITRLHEEGLPPYSVINKWRALYPEFNRMVEIAINDRAHVYADKAIETAEKTKTKDDAIVHRTQIDTYKWMAEKSNPDQYGTKTQLRGDKGAPLQLIVDTGVPAPQDRDVGPKDIDIGENNGRNEAAVKDDQSAT